MIPLFYLSLSHKKAPQMKKLLKTAALGLAFATAAPAAHAQQSDLSHTIAGDAAHVCGVWKKDSGIECTPEQLHAVVRLMQRTYPAMQRGGEDAVLALAQYQRGIVEIFGRMPRDPVTAAHNRAVGTVSDYCDTQPPRCTDAQRDALIDLMRDEYLRPAAIDEADAARRRASLNENIRRILRSDGAVKPPAQRQFPTNR